MNRAVLYDAARIIKVNPVLLDTLIRFESNWNPLAKNNLSGARGLIQFTDTTARELGYVNADDIIKKHPTAESQLMGPVLKYFTLPGKKPPYPTEQSFFMSVFYPAARQWPVGTIFPESVRKLNPGITTVKDYINKVKKISPALNFKNTIPLIIIMGIVLYTLTKKG